MAITFTNGSDGLFDRLGIIAGLIDDLNAFRGTTLETSVDALAAAYTDDPALIDTLYRDFGSHRSAYQGFLARLQRLAQSTLIEVINDDNPQENRTLLTALTELVTQMEDNAQSVPQVTVSASDAADVDNVGDAAWVLSVLNPDGTDAVHAFAEDIRAEVQNDAQPGGGATAGRELVRLRGKFAASGGILGHDFPMGSGATATVNAIDAGQDAAAMANLTTNGDFADWDEESSSASGNPDHWTIAVGSIGSTVSHESSSGFDEANALVIEGDSSTNVQLYQEFGDSDDGTSIELQPLTQYAVNLWLRTTGTPAFGVLRIALVDGDNNVVADEAGVDNSFNVDLTAHGTTFAPVGGAFRTPALLPATLRLELRMTTALETGTDLVIDEIGMASMTRVYPGGPSVALFSGATDLIKGDGWTIVVSNSSADGTWHRAIDRLFGARQLGIVLPDDGSPTIADSLIP